MFQCEGCKKEVKEVTNFSEYGLRYYNISDDSEYCDKCFKSKFSKMEQDKLKEVNNDTNN